MTRVLSDAIDRLTTQVARVANALEERFFDCEEAGPAVVDVCKACGCRLVPVKDLKCIVCGADMPLNNESEEKHDDGSEAGGPAVEGAGHDPAGGVGG